MKYASIFAGIGGFDVAMQAQGWSCSSMVEIDKNARKVLAERFPDVPLLGDVQEVTGDQLGQLDTLVGGFPCSDLSIGAPHRRGLDGARSGLYFEFVRLVDEYARIVDETNPRWVVLENVPGLLTSNGGDDLLVVCRTLAELGYVGSWRVVDAAHVGTAQRRRRVLFVAHRGEHPGARAVLADPEGGSAGAGLDHERGGRKPGRPPAGVGSQEHLQRLMFRKSRRPRSKTDFATWVESDLSNTLNGFDAGLARSTNIIVEGSRARMLTPLEWERLQGFPDHHTDVGLSDNQRFRLLGNAMAVPMASWLAHRIDSIPLLMEAAA